MKELKKNCFVKLNQDFFIEIETNSILAFKFFELSNLTLTFKVKLPKILFILNISGSISFRHNF